MQMQGNLDLVENWLDKEDKQLGKHGRAVFPLLKMAGGKAVELAGYGWTGPELSPKIKEEEPDLIVPGGKTTFAVRIANDHTGNGLAVPFTKLIVAGSAALYGARNIWLETWGSNNAARVYPKAGFEQVYDRKNQERPTLQPEGYEFPDGNMVYLNDDGRRVVNDTRLWMRYPNELLPTVA